ncbi:hypothetical protein [Clostridium sp. JN-9]|uniref:hypothetical protein n=1 Tax=Clostridium sp. JN-9 TaxID=2507159 RepID=UPI000FFE1381|nr:hypothetical protein [Clostridium sp. JN-9]QAT39519.1 hypothetical protein EQM05_04230 [Clostridium sp. JN-9]
MINEKERKSFDEIEKNLITAKKMNGTLQDIIDMANNLNNPADFGVNVAYILERDGLIDKAVRDIVAGIA